MYFAPSEQRVQRAPFVPLVRGLIPPFAGGNVRVADKRGAGSAELSRESRD